MLAVCAVLGLVLLTGVVYFPLLDAGLADRHDQHYLFEVIDVRTPSWGDVRTAFQRVHFPAGAGPCYQPLVSLSFLLDARFVTDWNGAAFHFHLTGWLLQMLNAVLLFALIRSISGSTFWALIWGLIFSLNPVQVESVAWIAQRGTLLAALFALLTLLSYLRFVRTGRFRWFIPVTFLYAAALLSSPLFLGLPVVLLILDVWPLRRRGWLPILEKIPLFVLLLVCAALHYYLRSHADPLRAAGPGGWQVLTRNVAVMIVKVLWPDKLTPFRPFPSEEALSGLGWLVDAAVVIGLPLGFVLSFRYCRPVFAAAAGTAMLVLPGLVDAPLAGQLLSDHYLYAVWIVPGIVWGAWIKPGGPALPQPWGRSAAMLAVAAVAVFAVQANIQTYYWHDSRALSQHTINLFPKWAGGHIALIESYIREGDLDSALVYARQATDAVPDDPSTQFYLGRVLLLHQDGRSIEAVGPLRRALASNPNWIDCLHHLGLALSDVGQVEQAVSYLERARDLQPRSPALRLDLGAAYLQAGRPAAARAEFQLVLNERNDPRAHLGLAKAWASNDMPNQARRHLAAAVAFDPRYAILAARYPALRRLGSRPDFESLIDLSDAPSEGGVWERLDLPPTRSSPGL